MNISLNMHKDKLSERLRRIYRQERKNESRQLYPVILRRVYESIFLRGGVLKIPCKAKEHGRNEDELYVNEVVDVGLCGLQTDCGGYVEVTLFDSFAKEVLEKSGLVDFEQAYSFVEKLSSVLVSVGKKSAEKGPVFEKGIISVLCGGLYNNKAMIEGPLFKYIFQNGYKWFENDPEGLATFEEVKGWLGSSSLAIKMQGDSKTIGRVCGLADCDDVTVLESGEMYALEPDNRMRPDCIIRVSETHAVVIGCKFYSSPLSKPVFEDQQSSTNLKNCFLTSEGGTYRGGAALRDRYTESVFFLKNRSNIRIHFNLPGVVKRTKVKMLETGKTVISERRGTRLEQWEVRDLVVNIDLDTLDLFVPEDKGTQLVKCIRNFVNA